MAYTQPYLKVLDTTTQAIAVADTEQVVTFNTTTLANKIAVTSSSRFTVNEAGNYNAIVNFQLTGSGANKVHSLWFKINGTNVANSNSQNEIVNSNDSKDISHSESFPMTAGQYLEVWRSGDATTLSLVATGTQVTPTRPAPPSISLILVKLP